MRTPEPQISSFNTKDITLSLTTSTSKTMQPDGPLAQLASEGSPSTITPDSSLPTVDFMPKGFGKSRGLTVGRSEHGNSGRRLASPFLARTYGPSSSQSLSTSRPSPPRTQSDDTGPPQLRSPLRFDQPRSLTGTQKRRAQHALDEELRPTGAVLRPSILDEQLFGTPLGHQRRVRSRGFSLGDEALRAPGIFQHLLPSNVELSRPRTNPMLLPPAKFEPPPRLGSPFLESGPSMTFPRRLFQDASSTIKRGAFATMHQTRHSIESFDFGEGPSFRSRLEQLDVKLKEIREREAVARRRGAE